MEFIVLYGYFPCFESSISGIEKTPFTEKRIGQLVLKRINLPRIHPNSKPASPGSTLPDYVQRHQLVKLLQR